LRNKLSLKLRNKLREKAFLAFKLSKRFSDRHISPEAPDSLEELISNPS